MIQRFKYGKLVWVDLENPTIEDIQEVGKHDVTMSEALANELLYPSPRGRIFKDGEAVCLTLHFPIMPFHQTGRHSEEIDFVITEKTIITVRFGPINAFYDIQKKLETAAELKRSPVSNGFDLFIVIVSELYATIDPELQKIDQFIIGIEKEIYNGNQREAVEQTSYTVKRILNFRRALHFHPELFNTYRALLSNNSVFIASTISHQLLHEVTRLLSILDEQRETMRELADTNKTLLSTHTNNVMKTFTILAFVTFPLTLVMTILSLNNYVKKFAEGWHGTLIILGILVVIALVMLMYFKHRKWM